MEKNRLLLLLIIIIVLLTPALIFGQEPIKVSLSIDGKECRCMEYTVVFSTSNSRIEIKSNDGYFIPDTTLNGKGDITIQFRKTQLIFTDLSLEVYKGGTMWHISIDYPPLSAEEVYSKDSKTKWAYSLVPGNSALITEFRYSKPRKIRCKKKR